MKVKFTLQRSGRGSVDLAATFDSTATVGELAQQLVLGDPERTGDRSAAHTVCLVERGSTALDPALPLIESGLHSGSRIALVRAGSGTDRQREDAAARVTVVAGPDTGREIVLGRGSSVIGREADCEVALSDELVSRRHARINVTDVVEVLDLGSANGTLAGGAAVDRVVLRASDVVQVGDTRLSISLLHPPTTTQPDVVGGSLGFVRSPVLQPRFGGEDVELPQPPERSRGQRLPVVSLLVPVVMGVVLYLITDSLTSLAFVALSPLMLVGSTVESRRNARLDFKAAVQAYDEDLAASVEDLESLAESERTVRGEENPGSDVLVAHALDRGPLLWSRRPDRAGFVELRLGTAHVASRTRVEVPRGGRAPHAEKAKGVEVRERFSKVGPVPVPAAMTATSVGVSGARRAALAHTRSLVVQAAVLHSPAELVLSAFLSAESAKDWDWLKWLPHTTSVHSPVVGSHLAVERAASGVLISQLEALLESREPEHAVTAQAPAVLVLVEHDPAVDHNRLVHLAEHGPARAIHVLWTAPARSALPASCRTFVDAEVGAAGALVGDLQEASATSPVTLDVVSAEDAERVARSLAPLVDLGARVSDASDLPRSISQLTLLGQELGDGPRQVLERWRESASVLTGPLAPAELPRRPAHLRAVLGQSAAGPHTIDLRVDGPHALVGGTTGAGKSELLQSWVLALAAAHSPQRVNFLFVDYKGGAAFGDCEDLPHSIGVVSDLTPHLVRRALASLGAELKHREELLRDHQAKDLAQLEQMGLRTAPPSLVIVVDEFAALVSEVPEFVDGVVNVAQRGRSLGLHLILATQRPAGVIKDNLRANTNLRIALRMADADDSTDVLGTPDAASFDAQLPGRALSKSGARPLVAFQSAYAGGWTTREAERSEIGFEPIDLSGRASWSQPPPKVEVPGHRDHTDIKRMVRSIGEAHRAARLPDVRRVWLPELADHIDLRALPLSETDDRLLLGSSDSPRTQEQPPVFWHPDRDANLAVFGTSGAGKSTVLSTIAIAAGYAAPRTPVQVFGLDFGSGGLAVIESMPHVGSIVLGSDHERLARLLTDLRSTIDERRLRYKGARAASLDDYRRQTGRVEEPRILLLLDGITSFRSAYETSERQKWVDLLVSILADGRSVGVHVCLTCDQRSGLTSAMAAAVPRRIVMRMAVSEDYAMLGVPSDVLDQASAPGRALDGTTELQVAILGAAPDVLSQAAEIEAFGQALSELVAPAPPVRRLPSVVPLPDLAHEPGRVAIGLSSDTLATLVVEPVGGFVLSGPSGSGRSTALQTLLASTRRALPRADLHLLGPRRSAVADLVPWRSCCTNADEVGEWATELQTTLESAAPGAQHVVVVESAGDHAGSMADLQQLTTLVRTAINDGHWVVVEGEASTLISTMGFLGAVKSSRTGVVLQPDQEMGASLLRTPFPRVSRGEFPLGRGLFTRSGRTEVVQVAVPWEVAASD